MTHKNRLLLFTSVLVLGTLLVAGTIGYKMGSSSLEQSTRDLLIQIRKYKAEELKTEFTYLKNTLVLTSEFSPLLDFMEAFPGEQRQVQQWLRGHGASARWRQEIIASRNLPTINDLPRVVEQLDPFSLFIQSQFIQSAHLQKRPLVEVATVMGHGNLTFFRSYEELHSRMYDIQERSHLDDILAIAPDGTIAYSTSKSLFLGDNLMNGPFSNSRLAQAYRWSLNAPKGATRFFDFTPISHFWHQPAAFMAMPLFKKNSYIGTLVFQIPLERIDSILSNNKGWQELSLGKTGELVAFGADGFLRNNSRLFLENPEAFGKKIKAQEDSRSILENIQRSQQSALSVILPANQIKRYMDRVTLFESSPDYLGTKSLLSVSRIPIFDNADWVLISKMDVNEALAPLSFKIPWFFIGAFLMWSLAIAAAWLLYRRMFYPAYVLEDNLEHLLQHDFAHKLPAPDEVEYQGIVEKVNRISDDLRRTKAAKDFLESVVQSLHEVFFVVEIEEDEVHNKTYRVRGHNPAAQELTEATAEALKNSDIQTWIEADFNRINESLSHEQSEKLHHSLEVNLKRLSGEKVPLELSWARIKIEGKSNLVVMIGADIRWKKELGKELRLKEELLKESQALSRTGSFRWDIKTGRCLWSEEEYHLLGINPGQITPSFDLFRSLIYSEDVANFDKALTEAHKNILPFHIDMRMRRRDTNELIWVRCQGRTEYDDYGNALFMYVTTQDITELRRAEQSLIYTKNEALKSSQAKSEFLAQMSHEIRTPMNAIMGMAELLKETKLDADQMYYVNIFCKAGEVLMSLINDILDLSKIEAGEVSIENIPFELKKLIVDLEEMMKTRAHEKGLACTCDIAPDVSPHLMGDPNKLRQVLINLVGNSIKFTNKGTVRMSIRKNPSKKDMLLVSITDTGIGIPEEKQHLIFQKFSQADSSITRKYGGTGLGLAISKSLVELMGGQIWFKSKPGTGTTFFFTIPYREQVQHPVTHQPLQMKMPEMDFAGAKPRDPNRKVRILIADDTEDNRTLFTHYLKNGPYEIIEAENGLQAIDQVKSGEFDIVFMDVQMPEMDGYAATDKIREWEREVHKPPVPIIALTARALAEDRQKSLRAGCNDHIAKPFKKDTLLGVINQYSL